MDVVALGVLTTVFTVAFIVIMIVAASRYQKKPQSPEAASFDFSIIQYNMSLNDVCGYEEVKHEIRDIIDMIKNRDTYTKYGVRMPKGILLYGPPGTGKTLLAKAISGECQIPFIFTCGASFEEKYVGIGAARIRGLFKFAKEHAPCIVFIDEIDALGFSRTNSPDSGHHAQTVNQLLAEMDGMLTNSNVIVIGATNMLETLDKALVRPGRFDRIIHVPLPNKEERRQIFEYHLNNKPHENINLDKMASVSYGMSGADIENVTNEAAIMAAKQSCKITMDILYASLQKVMLGAKKTSYQLSKNEKFRIAVHEVAHALLCYLTGRKVNKISIIPTSRGSLGYVHHEYKTDGEGILETKKDMLDSAKIALAGRAAEEVIISDVSTGALSDLQNASHIVKRMLECGMHDTLFVLHPADSITKKANKMLNELYADVKVTVQNNSNKIEKIANVLIEKEELDENEFVAMLDCEA